MHNPDPHQHRRKVTEGSASNIVGGSQRREEDYWRGLTADVNVAYAEWVLMRRAAGDLTVEMPKQSFHRADYVKGQGPQTQGDATDQSHLEAREEDDSD